NPYFFLQAEDGIRDFHVTGVQTCALPIYFVNVWSITSVERYRFLMHSAQQWMYRPQCGDGQRAPSFYCTAGTSRICNHPTSNELIGKVWIPRSSYFFLLQSWGLKIESDWGWLLIKPSY